MDNLIRLYESTEKAFTSGGLGCLSDTTSCVVSEERNGEYELELEYPINGIHYSDLAIRRIILCPPNPYDRPQPFRIYSISKPIKGIVTVNAAHISYDLNNYVCFPFIAQTSAEVFERLNGGHSESETSRIYPENILYNSTTNPYGFRFETDMIVNFPPKSQSQKPEPEDERFKVLIPKPIRMVLGTNDDCILGRFINSNGRRGEYFFDRCNVYLKDPDGNNPRGTDRGFEIRYGKNMTDVEKEETTKDDYTHILPFWKAVQSTDTTVAVLGGEGVAPVVQVPGSSGRSDVKIKIVDLSSEFDKSPTATKLTQYAQDYIHDNELTGQSKVSITVNFQSLARSSEYEAYAALEDVRLCDTVKVIYEALGIVDEKKVIRYDYNVLKESYDEIEIGDPREELANTLAKTSSTAANTQSAGETIKNGLVETITNAIKLSQIVYYLDTTETYDENNPPDPPSAWVADATGDANKWTNAEPVLDTDGELFTYSQNRLTDDTISISDFNFSKLASTVRSWVTGDNNDEINGESLANSSVKTNAVNDEAITSAKLAVDAVQSRTYTAGSDTHFSQTGTLINLAGTGYIRSKNFAIDSSGNAYFKGQVTATSGYIGSEQSGFLISDSSLTGTYLSGSDSYYVNMETDGTLMMRPVEFSSNSKYTSSILDEANFRMSAYHPDIGFHDQIDIYSSQDGMGIGFFMDDSTLSTSTAVEQFAIGGQHRTELGGIYASPENGNVTTTGEWVLSGDTYIAGHSNQTLKAWIEAIESSGYVLPPATTTTLGGVIVGSGLSVSTASGTAGTISVNTNTIATRTWVQNQGYLTEIPTATTNAIGGVKVPSGSGLSISSGSLGLNIGTGLDVDNDNNLIVSLSASNIPTITSAKISDFDSAVDTALGIGSGSTFLRKDGTWATPTNTTYTGEKGITVSSANKIGHSSTYTAKSTQAVYPITIDTYGHIASVGNAVTIPTVNDATLTIQRNGTNVTTFTANASSNVTANITVPVNVSELTNDLGYLTSIPTAGTNVIGGVKIPASSVISNNSGAIDIKYGTGLDVDDNNNLIIASTVALKTDIKNATLTIQKNGSTVKTFTANASSNVTANITVPTKVSDLTNDSGFLTSVSWSDVGSKPFNTIAERAGLTVANDALQVAVGNGLTFDDDSDAIIVDTSVVALKSEIKTYTGEKGISVSASNAIGHSSTYTAKTTQAVYPIKIDTYGHISAVGNAVTIPTVNNATLTIQKNGVTVETFTANASANATANITVPTALTDLAGTLPISQGGTGETTAQNAINALIAGLPVWSGAPTDSTYFIRQSINGTDAYGKIPFSALWTYIKGKADSAYIVKNETANTLELRRPLETHGIIDPTFEAKINTVRPNRLAFLPADQIIIEKTTDGGTTWEDAGFTYVQKENLFAERRPTISVPRLNGVKDINCGLRVTFTAVKYDVPSGTAETARYNYWNSAYVTGGERYCSLEELYFWVSSNSDGLGVTVERAKGNDSTTWSTIYSNNSFALTGWSGSDYIRFSEATFGSSTQPGNYWNYRITFMTRGKDGGTTLSSSNTTNAQAIYEIRGYGTNMWTYSNNYMANDHLYGFDRLQNATFPADVSATTFNGNLAGNVTGNLTGTASKATGDASGNTITTNYASSLSLNGHTLTLISKSGATLSTITVPDTTYTGGDGINISSGNVISVDYGAGLTIDGNDALAVSLSASDIPAITSAKISDFDTAVDTALGVSSGTTFLRKDGTWATPTGTTYSAGTGISISSANVISISAATTSTLGGVKVPSGSGLSISSGSLGLNIGTGLDVDNSNNLIVSLSASNIPTITSAKISDFTSAAKTAIGIASSGSTFLRKDGTWTSPTVSSIAWSSVTSKPFTSVNDTKGLVITSDKLELNYGSGLTIDGDTGAVIVDTTTIAQLTDIPTNVSAFTNDSGYLTSADIATTSDVGVVKPDGTYIVIDSDGEITLGTAWQSYVSRTYGFTMPVSAKTYRYRIFFTSADGTQLVPSTTSTTTNATTARLVNQTPIDPFGGIYYYAATTVVSAGSTPGYQYLRTRSYGRELGYAFNPSGGTLALTLNKPIYIKCAPRADGSAIIDADTPFTQDLPQSADGFIYIYLGLAYSATIYCLSDHHPVYYYNGGIKLWTGASGGSTYSGGDGISIASNVISAKYGDGITIDGNDALTVPASASGSTFYFTGGSDSSGVSYSLAPYPSTTATSTWVGKSANYGKFYLGTIDPTGTTRLNYNGYLYAKDIYVDGSSVDARLTALEQQICLIEGTKIKMADGTEKNIEDIKVGDMVLSYNPSTNEQIPAMALQSIRTGISKDYDVLIFENGNYAEMYKEHSVYDVNLGYPHSHVEWKVGDEGLMADGSISKLARKTTSRHAIIKNRYVLCTSTGLYFANGILMGLWASTKYNIVTLNCYNLNLPEKILNEFKRCGELNDRSNLIEINPDYISQSKTLQKKIHDLSTEIEDCKKNLLDTDYMVAKFTEGLISTADWLKSKASRANWRTLINKDESPLAEAKEQLDVIKAKIRGDNPSLREIYAETVTSSHALLPDFQEWYAEWSKNNN